MSEDLKRIVRTRFNIRAAVKPEFGIETSQNRSLPCQLLRPRSYREVPTTLEIAPATIPQMRSHTGGAFSSLLHTYNIGVLIMILQRSSTTYSHRLARHRWLRP